MPPHVASADLATGLLDRGGRRGEGGLVPFVPVLGFGPGALNYHKAGIRFPRVSTNLETLDG